MVRAVVAQRGPFGLCVYCAGIGEPLDVQDLSREVDVFQVNLLGAVETLAAVVPAMVAAGTGQVVVLSSLADEVLSSDGSQLRRLESRAVFVPGRASRWRWSRGAWPSRTYASGSWTPSWRAPRNGPS